MRRRLGWACLVARCTACTKPLRVTVRPYSWWRRCDDPAKRQAELFIEHHDQRDHLRAQLRRGRAEGVRGLEGIPPLHAAAARRTAPHVDIELPDDHAGHRQLFLILKGDPGLDDRPGQAGHCAGSGAS